MQEYILNKILLIPAILIASTVHEYSHALVADKLGDKTPQFQGRLTLNPIVHVDIIGFIMILIAGFGWAKPVQVNPRAFKNYYKDDLKVSFAGPLANIIAAFIFAIIFGLVVRVIPSGNNLTEIIITIIYLTMRINIMLFIFNLLPLPGLDGFHILRDLFPKTFYNVQHVIYKYQYIILLIFIISPISDYLVLNPTIKILNLFIKMTTFGI